MKLTFIILFGFILSNISSIKAQDLVLTSGSKSKTIKAGTFIELYLSPPNLEPCRKCPLNGIRGQLVSSIDGKLTLKVYHAIEPITEENSNIGNVTKNYKKKDVPTQIFSRENILSITVKGKKKIKKYTPPQSVGMVLILFGFGHLISAPIVSIEDNDTANTLIGVGLTEMALGIALETTFKQKTYFTSEACPNKKTGNKLWVIN